MESHRFRRAWRARGARLWRQKSGRPHLQDARRDRRGRAPPRPGAADPATAEAATRARRSIDWGPRAVLQSRIMRKLTVRLDEAQWAFEGGEVNRAGRIIYSLRTEAIRRQD